MNANQWANKISSVLWLIENSEEEASYNRAVNEGHKVLKAVPRDLQEYVENFETLKEILENC